MLQRGAFELRIALTDWLSSLREIVRARNSEAKQQSSRVQQAGKNGLDVGYEARTGPEEVAGGLYDPYQQPRAPGVAASATQAEGARTASGLLEESERADASEALPLSTRLRLAASTLGPEVIAALEPLLAPLLPALLFSSSASPARSAPAQRNPPPPLISLPAVTHFLTAVEQSFEPFTAGAGSVAGDSTENEVATRFEALGTVAAWLIEQLEVVAASEEGDGTQQRREGQERGDGRTAAECMQRLALLLANLATIASHDPTSLQTLIFLLTTQLGGPSSSPSSFSLSRPVLTVEIILPFLVRQLVTLLRELVLLNADDEDQNTLRPPPAAAPNTNTNSTAVSDRDQWLTKTETISILLSLSHLVLDSVSSRDDEKLNETDRKTIRTVADQVRGELVRLLGTHGVDVQLAEVPLAFTTTADGEAAGISIESGVVGLIERLWELQGDDEVLAAPVIGSGHGGVA